MEALAELPGRCCGIAKLWAITLKRAVTEIKVFHLCLLMAARLQLNSKSNELS